MKILPKPLTFEWDKGNIDKNLKKHRVTNKEAEEAFVNSSKYIFVDDTHSVVERRYMLWGVTNKQRKLAVFFAIRKNSQVRIISARDMNKKERGSYEEKTETYSKV